MTKQKLNKDIIKLWMEETLKDSEFLEITNCLNMGLPLKNRHYEILNKQVNTLLAKLNKLDRKNVKKLLIKLLVDKYSPVGYAEKDIDEIVDQILSLIPEEGEVIAEANSKVGHNSIVIYAFDYVGTMRILANFKINKEIQIIIREVK